MQLSDLRLDLEPIVGDPSWATVRAIHLGSARNLRSELRPCLQRISALIAHPVMRSLQQVTESDEPLMIEREADGGCAFVPRFG